VEIDPYEAGLEAEEEAENELAYAEEREREDEEAWERKEQEKQRKFDEGLQAHLDAEQERSLEQQDH